MSDTTSITLIPGELTLDTLRVTVPMLAPPWTAE